MSLIKFKNQIYIKIPDKIHSSYGLCICHEDSEQITKFVLKIRLECAGVKYFVQGLDRNWAYIEFWGNQTEEFQNWLLDYAIQLGSDFDLPVHIGEPIQKGG